MSKKISLATMVLLFFHVVIMQNVAHARNVGNFYPEQTEAIIIQEDDVVGYQVSWSPLGTGNAPYSLTVYNLTTATMHTQTYVSGTNTHVFGLVNGNTYRVMVSRGALTDAIIIDIIDIG